MTHFIYQDGTQKSIDRAKLLDIVIVTPLWVHNSILARELLPCSNFLADIPKMMPKPAQKKRKYKTFLGDIADQVVKDNKLEKKMKSI